jgi:DNA polymerase III subunit epsilon
MRFISFDLETTGFIAGVDRIIELGAVRYVNGVVDSVYATLVDPQIDIPEGASRVNGISNEMVKGKPTIDALLPSFAEFCGDDILVAHNAPFDYQFLNADVIKHEVRAPRGTVLDTCVMARKLIPGLPNYKLGTLVQHLNIPAGEFHRAEEDANYCGQLFIKMIEKMSGGLILPPLENLISLSGKSELKFTQIVAKPKQMSLLDML